jgi:cytochrome P450
MGYVLPVFECIQALKQWPPWLRPFVYRFIPMRAAINKQWAKGRERVLASMEARKAKGSNLEAPPSILDNLSAGKNENLADDVEKQLLYQMTLVAVGTVTTFASIVQIIYDLAVHPEYIPLLREEVQCAERDENGYFTKDSLSAMKKMDSFIKESQRLKAADLSRIP